MESVSFYFEEFYTTTMDNNGDTDTTEAVVKIDRIAALTAEAVIEASAIGI